MSARKFKNNPARQFIFIFSLVTLVLFTAGIQQAWAQKTDQAILLEADQVDINGKKNISVYQGNVKLSHGDTTILADKITVHKTKKGLGKFFALGKPVTFHSAANADKKEVEVKGEALEIEYDAKKEIVILKNKAKLWQSKDQFSGNLIVYNVKQASVTANRGNKKSGRIQVVIHPENNSTK